MARLESDREDLFAELKVYSPKVEWNCGGEPESVVAGLKADGAVSIYFGGDPAYHFDRQARLRRAFAAGALYRSGGEVLTRLERRRLPSETLLDSHDLTPHELAAWFLVMQRRIEDLFAAHWEGRLQTLRRMPEDPAGESQILEALANAIADPRLAPCVNPSR